MEPPTYQRKYESTVRALERIEEFYNGKIDKKDSFSGPKDFVYTYFHSTYSLKESLKNISGLDVESFIKNNHCIALGIDISNAEKHGELSNPKTNKKIGKVNTHIHFNFFDSNKNDRTELTIEIEGEKMDCLTLAKENLNCWRNFLLEKRLIK